MIDCRACDCPLRAIECGHFGCVRRLHAEGARFTSEATEVAAAEGDLDILRFLHEEAGLPFGNEVTWEAAYNGHLECLHYAHMHGAVWHKETTFDAAYYGHWMCVRYAAEHGCPIHPETLRCAALGGNPDCLEYVLGIMQPTQDIPNDQIVYWFTSCSNITYDSPLDLFVYVNIRKLFESLKNPSVVVLRTLNNFRERLVKIQEIIEAATGLPSDVIKFEVLTWL